MDASGFFSDSWHVVAARRYAVRPDCRVHRQVWRNQRWHVLRDPYTNRFYRVTPRAWEFLRQLDGRAPLDAVWQRNLTVAPAETPGQDEIVRWIGELTQAGLLQSDQPSQRLPALQHDRKQRSRERGASLLNFLFVRVPLWDPNRLLNQLAPIGALMLNRWGALLWALLIATGLIAVAGRTEELRGQTEGLLAADNLGWLYLAWLGVKLFHELGHGMFCKRFGGEVHTLGAMLLVFTPVPYVDATSAWGFRERWQRVLTGAGGMIFELAVAAVAAVIWAHTHDDLLHQLCYNVMFISSVSTLLFNANPLLRFDGYYILCDLFDLPNLASRSQRQLQYVAERFLFGCRTARPATTERKEAAWLCTYGIASTLYRLLILAFIIDFVAGAFLGLGIVLAIAAGVFWFILPVARFIRYALTEPRLAGRRVRVASVLGAIAAGAIGLLAFVPVEDGFTAEGLLVAGSHRTLLAPVDGWVAGVSARSGQDVAAGQPLLRLENRARQLGHARGLAALDEIGFRILQAQDQGPSFLDTLQASRRGKQQEVAQIRADLDALEIRAPIEGRLQVPLTADLLGRFVQKGAALGAIYDFSTMHFEAVVAQTEASRLFEQTLPGARVKIVGQPGTVLTGAVREIKPAEKTTLPSASLGLAAGGNILTNPRDPRGLAARDPYYSVTVQLDERPDLPRIHSLRGRVRFGFPPRPLGHQLYRKLRQLLLDRYQT